MSHIGGDLVLGLGGGQNIPNLGDRSFTPLHYRLVPIKMVSMYEQTETK